METTKPKENGDFRAALLPQINNLKALCRVPGGEEPLAAFGSRGWARRGRAQPGATDYHGAL